MQMKYVVNTLVGHPLAPKATDFYGPDRMSFNAVLLGMKQVFLKPFN